MPLYGVQSWCWPWARDVRTLVFALAAAAAREQPWRQLARQAVLRGKQVAAVPAAAYGGCKDASEAWAAGGLHLGVWPTARDAEPGAVPDNRCEDWAEREAIMVADGGVPPTEAARLAWRGLHATERHLSTVVVSTQRERHLPFQRHPWSRQRRVLVRLTTLARQRTMRR